MHEELVVCKPTNEVNCTVREDNEEDCWDVKFVEGFHQTVGCTCTHEAFHLLMRFLLDVFDPVAKLTDLVVFIVCFSLGSMVEEVV